MCPLNTDEGRYTYVCVYLMRNLSSNEGTKVSLRNFTSGFNLFIKAARANAIFFLFLRYKYSSIFYQFLKTNKFLEEEKVKVINLFLLKFIIIYSDYRLLTRLFDAVRMQRERFLLIMDTI